MAEVTAARVAMGQPDLLTRWSWRIVLWTLTAITMLGAAVSPRFYNGDRLLSASLGGPANRLAMALLLVAVVLSLADGRIFRGPRGLLLSALAFGTCAIVSAVVAGHEPADHAEFALPLIALTMLLSRPITLNWAAMVVGRPLLLFIYGSLLAAAALPRYALQSHYTQGFLPIDRLHGLASHANVLGPIAVTYLVISWVRPGRSLGRVHVVAALVVLVLTQSKTAIGAYLVVMAARYLLAADVRGTVRRVVVVTALVGGIAAVLAVAVVSPDTTDVVKSSSAGTQAQQTFSSRYAIWAATYATWKPHPVLGYGPDLWGSSMRVQLAPALGFDAPSAHNQVMQTLGESGAIGLALLALYLAALAATGMRTAAATGGASLALVGLLLFRCIDEAPFRTSLSDGSLLLQVCTLAILVAASSSEKEAEAHP